MESFNTALKRRRNARAAANQRQQHNSMLMEALTQPTFHDQMTTNPSVGIGQLPGNMPSMGSTHPLFQGANVSGIADPSSLSTDCNGNGNGPMNSGNYQMNELSGNIRRMEPNVTGRDTASIGDIHALNDSSSCAYRDIPPPTQQFSATTIGTQQSPMMSSVPSFSKQQQPLGQPVFPANTGNVLSMAPPNCFNQNFNIPCQTRQPLMSQQPQMVPHR